MLPALFVSHGAPTLPFDDVPARDFLRGLGQRIGRPKAILCVSAHWDTAAPALNAVATNTTIHDFHGFPEQLYRVRYDAPGAPQLAGKIATLLHGAGHAATLDPERGLDHGAWVPLMLMYPDADIPVLQLSVQSAATPAQHIALGRALAPLREEGVLILGSGGFVHNLRLLDRHGSGAPEPQWSAGFAEWVHNALIEGREDDLANYRRLAPDAARAQPTEEHFTPLFVAYGAGGKAERLHRSATFGSLRMDAYSFA
ncbi:MAG TPA: class III extradiol ring-cleavage dioxygenase [Rhizomicrobium sp.]|jgi:4,5-DOPA dioxygenase extradiol|nr:class III extradiol ring-cleavage dioxygenase [Rhizomicrobium sp.]